MKISKSRQRADDDELGFGFQQLAVFAAPIEMIAIGEVDGLVDGGLAGVDDAFEVAALHGKLDADVARVVFAIDEGCAGAFFDGGELGERDLLAGGSGDEEIADVAGAGAELRLHADDEVEEFFALDDLGGGLAADGGLHNGSDVVDIDAIARDFGAVGVDDQAGLAEFAHDGEFGEAGSLVESVANLDGLLSRERRGRGRRF